MIHPITSPDNISSRHSSLFGFLRRVHTTLAKARLIIIARQLITRIKRPLNTLYKISDELHATYILTPRGGRITWEEYDHTNLLLPKLILINKLNFVINVKSIKKFSQLLGRRPINSRHSPLFWFLRHTRSTLAKTRLIIIALELITCKRRSLDTLYNTSDDNCIRRAF